MVLRDASLSDRHRKDLAIVGKSGEHLLELIDEVLDMAKIETGGTVVENASIDLHRLVNDTVNMLRERAAGKEFGTAPRHIFANASVCLRPILASSDRC